MYCLSYRWYTLAVFRYVVIPNYPRFLCMTARDLPSPSLVFVAP